MLHNVFYYSFNVNLDKYMNKDEARVCDTVDRSENCTVSV